MDAFELYRLTRKSGLMSQEAWDNYHGSRPRLLNDSKKLWKLRRAETLIGAVGGHFQLKQNDEEKLIRSTQ